LQLASFESVDGRLARVLRDVSVHDFVVDFKSISVTKFVGVLLGGSEDEDLSSLRCVAID
jgi:hypothetical protein